MANEVSRNTNYYSAGEEVLRLLKSIDTNTKNTSDSLGKGLNTGKTSQTIDEAEKNRKSKKTETAQVKLSTEKDKDLTEGLKDVKSAIKELGTSLASSMNKYSSTLIDKVNSLNSYYTTITTRLDGTAQSFETLASTVSNNASLTYSSSQFMANINSLVEKGIAYNIEQRAFLETIKDSVSTTFDAANSTLLRIIRLQSEDSTAARMGMEVLLNRTLNSMYLDTSYLTSDTNTNVTSALLEAESLMSATVSTEFENVVQTWLGSLYSVGLSDSTTTGLASAIGKLASGDISGITGSDGLSQLLVVALARAGMSVGDILNSGLSTTEANTLLASVVDYMQEINETSSLVARNAYASTYGLTMSDLQAASNSNLYAGTVYDNALTSYSNLQSILSERIGSMQNRQTYSSMLSGYVQDSLYRTALSLLSDEDSGQLLDLYAGNFLSKLGGVGSILGSILSINALSSNPSA